MCSILHTSEFFQRISNPLLWRFFQSLKSSLGGDRGMHRNIKFAKGKIRYPSKTKLPTICVCAEYLSAEKVCMPHFLKQKS